MLADKLETNCGLNPKELLVSVMTNTDVDWSFGFGKTQYLTGELQPYSPIIFYLFWLINPRQPFSRMQIAKPLVKVKVALLGLCASPNAAVHSSMF